MGRIETDSVLLAWGTTEGNGNTIGRDSIPLEGVSVEVAGRRIEPEQNWVVVDGLLPDTAYSYRVLLDQRIVGEGTVRTYPKKSEKLSFFRTRRLRDREAASIRNCRGYVAGV